MLHFILDPSRPDLQLKKIDKEKLRILKNKSMISLPANQCLLEFEHFQQIIDAFRSIDTFGENLVSLKQLLHTFRNSPKIVSILPQAAILLPLLNKILPFERFIYEWEQYMYLGTTEKDRKTRDKITLEDFLTSLDFYERRDIPTRDKVIQAQRLAGKINPNDIIELPKEFIQLIKYTFNEMDKTQKFFVRKFEFLDSFECQRDLKKIY